MRRAGQGLIISVTLLAATACGTAAGPTPGVPAGTGGAAPAATQTADAATKSTCEALGQVYSKNMGPFAEALAQMIAARRDGGDEGYPQVKKSLTAFATAVRAATKSSTDPQVQTAGEETADRLQAKAADARYFKTIKTTEDVNTVLGPTLKEWLAPVKEHCS